MEATRSKAKVFISYSNKDKELVKSYVEELRKYNYEIFWDEIIKPGQQWDEALMQMQRDADGTIVFLTDNGIRSKHVNSEVGLARGYYDSPANKKFLIPLVGEEIEVPYTIKDIANIKLNESSIEDNVSKIVSAINLFMTQKENDLKITSESTLASDIEIAKKYLSDLTTFIEKQAEWWNASASWLNREYRQTIENSISDADFYLSQTSVNSPIFEIKGRKTAFIDSLHAVVRITKQFDNNNRTLSLITSASDNNNAVRGIALEALDKFGLIPEEKTVKSNYWILKIADRHWDINQLQDGEEIYFQSHTDDGKQREGYQEFQKVAQGDIVFGYAYGNINAIFCRFEITKALYNDDAVGQIIRLRITELIKPYLDISSLTEKINFADELSAESGKKLFQLQEVVYDEILSLKGEPLPAQDRETVTALNSDVPDGEAADSLGITPDVNALASVIAYKDLKTPLAIGLFGNWGSGKSFFMQKLKKQIDEFKNNGGDDYVKHVVHIEFNSWHYSDSNLWASFVTKIFEELDAHGKKDPDSVKELFQQLNENSEFLAEAKSSLAGIQSTIDKLEEELATKKSEISEKAKELSKAKLFKISVSVFNNPDVKEKLEVVKKFIPQKELNNLEDISRSIKELNTFAGRFKETINLLFSFNSKQSVIALALFIIICASPWWLQTFFAVDIQKFFNWFGKYSQLAATIFMGVGSIATYATTMLARVNEKLKSAQATANEIKTSAILEHQSEVEKIHAELDMQQQAHIQKESEINKLKKQQAETQAAIDDIQSGKKLASFISSKVNDQRYAGSLGIISWIRKDFKKLDEILKEQRLVNKLKKISEEEREKIFQVDRIVLYIDDLDRCKEDIVVRVLEAIHLLLAFELFVVVVGVDPRWMHNALNNNYRRQLRIYKSEKEKIPDNKDDELVNAATSYDYLEKIFQIPFALNEIEPKGKKNLIDDLTKISEKETQSDIKTTVTVTNIAQTTTNNEGTVIDERNNIKETLNIKGNTITNIEESKKAVVAENQKQDAINKVEKTKQKELEAEKQKKVLKKAKEQLIISPDEIKFMKEISELIGNSPRTINRYINIYRIIRSHNNLANSKATIKDYCAVMVLLGIITGLPNESEEFFKSFAAKNSGTFESLIRKLDGNKFKLVKDASIVSYRISDTERGTVGELSIEFMKTIFELVQRFSFRKYAEYEKVIDMSQNVN